MTTKNKHLPEVANLDYRLLSALVQQLPREDGWTQAKRERWMRALGTAIDLLVEVLPEEEQSDDPSAEGPS